MCRIHTEVLMEEIWRAPVSVANVFHYFTQFHTVLHSFIHLGWCTISSINSMWMYVVCFCQCTRRCYSEVWGYLRLLETKDEVVGDSEDVENPASGRCMRSEKESQKIWNPFMFSRERDKQTNILELDAKSLQSVQRFYMLQERS